MSFQKRYPEYPRREVRKKYTFDDLLLVPKYSEINSISKEITTRITIGRWHLDVPIISAAMDTVTDASMQRAMRKVGCIGIHHRYVSDYEVLINAACIGPVAVSPSMGLDFIDKLSAISTQFTGCLPTVAIDVAHGHRKEVLDFALGCAERGLDVWSGNIISIYAAEEYIRRGVNILKVGIGPGSACTTRVVSGCGYPQASALMEIKSEFPEATLISDGGINTSGDIVKALACGADAVIIGRLLAGTEEAPGELVLRDGMHKKVYRGMASREALEESGKTVRVEGIASIVPYSGPVSEVVTALLSGIRTGMAYTGARTIKELQDNAEFVEITTAGIQEGMARI